jgi:flagellar biosynthesis chaperone FliJ
MSNNTKINIQDHIDTLHKVIQKNEHLIESTPNEKGERKAYEYSSRMVLSKNIEFLEAIRKEMGGELINTQSLGTFLYFDHIQ